MKFLCFSMPFTPLRFLAGLVGCCLIGSALQPLSLKATEPTDGPFAENVILVSLDGLRAEEVFRGADKRLILPELGCDAPKEMIERYCRPTAKESRQVLMPFLWQQVTEGGWIAGDVDRGSLVTVENGRYFSYPGYNEILTGHPDERIDSNAKKYNQNRTVLEWLNTKPEIRGRVAAFCSWDVFPFIINDRRSGIPVNAGWMELTVGNQDRLAGLNFAADNLFHVWDGVRYDVFTASGALEAMKADQPRVLYVALGETDDWAHKGRYDRYLLAAKQNDYFIRQLWDTAQSIPAYRDRTAFLLVTDHGRGDGREGWKNHGDHLPGSERIWLAAFGSGIAASGNDQNGRYTQGQVAATVAALLGYNFEESSPEVRPALPILPD